MSLRLGPRYRVLGEIASGGMGSVHLAIAKDEGGHERPVALKQMHTHLAGDPHMVEMFVDEARIASRLRHPNVIHVDELEMLGQDVVLVMDFVEGISLSALLRKLRDKGMPMPVPIARRVMRDALLGLHAAHELTDEAGAPLGVIHRDVSPHNVLLGTDGVARITDFGVAMARGRIASTQADGTVKGKLQYLAPEQVYRRPLDRRADVFSAGIVLWECLTGKKLFAADSEGETLAAVMTADIRPPSVERLDLPLELDEICLRALEREPKRRYATAADFALAIEQSGELASPGELSALVLEAGATSIADLRALLARRSEPPVDATDLPPRRGSRARVAGGILGAVAALAAVVTVMALRAGKPVAASPTAAPSPMVVAEPTFAIAPPGSASVAPPVASQAPRTVASSTPSPEARPGPKPVRARGRTRDGGGVVRPFEPDDL